MTLPPDCIQVKIVNGTGGEDGRKDPNFQRKEIGQKGVVKWSTYSQYFLSGANVWIILLFIILTLCMHGCEVFVQIWLSIWTGKAEDYQQVWALTLFYSVDFSLSRICINKCVFNKRTIKVCGSCC